ncbi:glycine betaine ABC transporter substrate-binding protein [Halomonas sp. KAO]|uniref:glycine betaine ABC transporter substrate-binding protein n=1 Tax=Halomonas sp. KAO TaxID=2783858 RepID=UPI002B4BEF1F|nr:glycine betaine ABC transporter substrate-binding protein [Halomonas sp. KAO]
MTSVTGLDAHRDRFDGEIQGIEAGAGINTAILKAIDNDLAGLGDWDLRESSTAAMLAQAERKMADSEFWLGIALDER